ncbi:HD domain-containing protein [Ornithinibacillus salinisoli]|uniref:HD domain-containing protein n=1 Tax=Ornithinibacillus salinisoli TaxID=1848459 RepID=A0ABW4VZ28_9BACI
MFISDQIYGEYKIDKVLEELVLSQPVQRLKGVHQGGASYLVNENWNVTRFDHSIGVMLLIRRLGGSLEEQIAGLLHDVSHTAFSHVIDYVLENKDEDYHDKIFGSVIRQSEIPAILAKYHYDYKDILLDISKWTLLEQQAPELCADRVDYTLRDMYSYGHISHGEIQEFLSNLIIVEDRMYLQSIDIAEWFVDIYYKEVIDFFMDPLNIYGYDILAKTLKLSLDKNILTINDFNGIDEEVIFKLKSTTDVEVKDQLNQLHQNVRVTEDKVNYDIHRKNKVRLIDPSVLCNNELIKASILSDKVRDMSVTAYEKAKQGRYVKIISN